MKNHTFIFGLILKKPTHFPLHGLAISIFFSFFLISSVVYAQAPATTCAGAATLTVGGACGSGIISDNVLEPGVNNANICASGQNAQLEGWFRFQATATTALVTANSSNRNLALQVFSGPCGSLVQIGCSNSITTANSAQTESTSLTGLTIGAFYYIRISNIGATNMGLSSLCITVPACNAGNLYTSGFTPTCNGTTQTIAFCQFAGEYSIVTLTAGVPYVFGSSVGTDFITIATDPANVIQVSGTQPVSFTPGVTGTYRIYTHSDAACGLAGGCRDLTVTCLNDNPCQATNLAVTVSCVYTFFTNAGATASAGVPAPGCAGYGGGDVWFTATVPASGQLNIDTQTGVMLDGGMAVYTGSCASLSLLSCDDNNSPNGNMPALNLTGLTPGATIWIRIWENGNNNNGTFGICVIDPNPPPNPADCPNAINVCGNTSFNVTPNGSGNILEYGTCSVSNPCTNPNCCNSGCQLTGELNTTWLLVTIQTSGLFKFSLGAPGGFGCYDWIMWGPYNASTCTNIANNNLAPVACNWNANCQQFTGMANPLPVGGLAGDFEQPIAVTAGQKYMISVSNYSGLTTNIPVNFFGTAGIGCGPLPIELQSFSCAQRINQMHLEWITSSEINNNYFIIERSSDGVNFEDIGKVSGSGNSNTTLKYDFYDLHPFAGDNYYRLKQVDYDGKNETFGTSSCEFTQGQESEVNVYNMTGQLIQTIRSTDYMNDVNALILPTAMYLVEVITGNEVMRQTHYHGTGGAHWYGN
jgi:hypothetical protein